MRESEISDKQTRFVPISSLSSLSLSLSLSNAPPLTVRQQRMSALTEKSAVGIGPGLEVARGKSFVCERVKKKAANDHNAIAFSSPSLAIATEKEDIFPVAHTHTHTHIHTEWIVDSPPGSAFHPQRFPSPLFDLISTT